MSARRPRRRQDEAPAPVRHPFSDIRALGLITVGALLFLALYTYTPDDVPSRFSISSRSVPNDPVLNAIGPFGAIVGGYTIFLVGPAAFLIPASLIWLGMSRVLMPARRMTRPTLGFGLLVLSASAVLGLQTSFFQKWWDEYNIMGSGGAVGFMVNLIAQKTIGALGGIICGMLGYFSGLILMIGLELHTLVAAGHRVWNELRGLVTGRREQSVAQAASLEAERLLAEHQRTERERRRLERELRTKTTVPAGLLSDEVDPETELTQEDLPLDPVADPAVPEPRIIDGSARRAAASGEKKLSLSEWKKQQQDKAKANGDGAPGGLAAGDFSNYQLPPLALLHWDEAAAAAPADVSYLRATQNNIIKTLSTFGISVAAGDITRGPTITRYEIYPSEGLRVSRISALEADLARATRAERINILAPIPGKDTVGIEIANKDKVAVPLRELLEDPAFHSGKCRLPLALGKDVYGETIVADLAGMPHLLVAGATGSGKSVCINSIIASLLFQFTPEQLRFILIDPKVVEMQTYNDLPHLVVPVVTDPKKVIMALRWVVNEMENRYRMFADEGVRNFETFNGRKKKAAEAKAKNAAKAAAQEPLLPLFEPEAEAEPEPETAARSAIAADTKKAGITLPKSRSVTPLAEFELPEDLTSGEPLDGFGPGFDAEDPNAAETEEFEAEDDAEVTNEDEAADADATEEEDDDTPGFLRPDFTRDEAEAVLSKHEVRLREAYREEQNVRNAPDIWEEDSELVAEEEMADLNSIPDSIPYIVVIIDELADLMQTAPADMEGLIARIAQKARAAGIHMILATQTPRAEVITGTIKANVPCRIAFQVSSALDSRVILDAKGADKLVGKGDMLYVPPGTAKMVRAQGAFVTDDEIVALVQHCKEQSGGLKIEASVNEAINGPAKAVEKLSEEEEETLQNCIDIVMQERKASTSLLQRRLRLGYGRAARMMDLMEQRGIIGPSDGPTKPREILIDLDGDDD
ncbi:MAG: 4tm region of dna translocase ftsk/spoiiie [Verrucomicrobiales bacterium]|nr:4tm region of dna translocase ftsk/spoiiie [Verrucomicrobiales bacterium]